MKILISDCDQGLINYRWISIASILGGNPRLECEQGEAEKIVCHDLFSSCKRNNLDLLKYIAKKVKIGGKIIIVEPDLISLLLSFYIHKTVTINRLNELVFEDGLEIRSIIDPKELEQILKELNFETSLNYQNGYITIKGTRKE